MPGTFRILSMKTNVSLSLLLLITFLPLTLACSPAEDRGTPGVESGEIFELPPPVLQSSYSVEEALQSRRSIRRYSDESVDLQSVSQILWSAQGVTLEERGYRTAPSAGARFPLETYLLVGNVEGLPVGMYHYIPDEHHLVHLIGDDIKS